MIAEQFELEEHFAATNRFFQLTGFTLDDMNEYAAPFHLACNAVRALADGQVTPLEAADMLCKAATGYRAIDAALELANAAQ